ncbi:MAG: cytochrome-c peroxidase [Colwellia sp.]
MSCSVFSVVEDKSLRAQYGVDPSQWPEKTTADNRKVTELSPLVNLKPLPKAEIIALGKQLFNDTLLSKDRTVSCATCHEKRLAFNDNRKTAVGIGAQVGTRNTPPIFGIDQWQSFFWDGRAKTAEQQSLMPIENPIEMNLSLAELTIRLNNNQYYQQAFYQIFKKNKIDTHQLSKAIVAFERTIKPPASLFTQFIQLAYNKPKEAVALLTDQQLNGLHLFRTQAKCMTCHNGALLSDNQFHVTGLHYYQRKHHDIGRYEFTQKVADSGKFRTPSLLGLSKTAPYMHNGLFPNLKGIVNMYNMGMVRPKRKDHQKDDPLFPETSDLLHKLALTKQDKADLVSFLEIL